MSFDINNPYVRTKVLTASPEELRLMLIEGAIRFMRAGQEGLAAKNYEKSYENLTNAKNILIEMMNTLRHEVAPELCQRLESLYTYMFTTLTYASLERDTVKIEGVVELMEFERETWVMLMAKLAKERGSHGQPSAAHAPTAATGTYGMRSDAGAAGDGRRPLSVQG